VSTWGAALDVADWRRRVAALYTAVRDHDDPAEAHRLWRDGRDRLFAEHPSSPLTGDARERFRALDGAGYDPAWRFELEVLPAEAARIEVPTGTDGVVPFERIGRVEVPDAGPLDLWRLASYGGGLFLPMRDAGSGRPGGGYGGGRYVLDTVKGADLGMRGDRLVIDLNFAYNPSCAYDEAWACPLAPPGNVLPVEVPVGERAFTP
jgi:uncharacterized protein